MKSSARVTRAGSPRGAPSGRSPHTSTCVTGLAHAVAVALIQPSACGKRNTRGVPGAFHVLRTSRSGVPDGENTCKPTDPGPTSCGTATWPPPSETPGPQYAGSAPAMWTLTADGAVTGRRPSHSALASDRSMVTVPSGDFTGPAGPPESGGVVPSPDGCPPPEGSPPPLGWPPPPSGGGDGFLLV